MGSPRRITTTQPDTGPSRRFNPEEGPPEAQNGACDVCGALLDARQCKLRCDRCGFVRDCSDP